MEDCIFCKIARREIPATVIYNDQNILAFMDLNPIIKGHALVIPKKHYDPITATPDDLLAEMMAVAKKIAAAQEKGLRAEGINIVQNNGTCAGQAVPHIHIHVIPRFGDDGHHWNWNAKEYSSGEEMETFAKQIQAAL